MTRPHKYDAKPGWHDEQLRPCGKELGIYYFKSRLELRYAGILEQLRRAEEIKGWEYEPEKWDFNDRVVKPFRRNSTFTVDFRVWKNGGYYYVEVTGPLYSGKITKIKRAIKLFPERDLRVYTTRFGTLDAPDFVHKIEENQKRKNKLKRLAA